MGKRGLILRECVEHRTTSTATVIFSSLPLRAVGGLANSQIKKIHAHTSAAAASQDLD